MGLCCSEQQNISKIRPASYLACCSRKRERKTKDETKAVSELYTDQVFSVIEPIETRDHTIAIQKQNRIALQISLNATLQKCEKVYKSQLIKYAFRFLGRSAT